MSRALVVYYSRTGTTRRAAAAVQRELGCDIEAIVDLSRRSGLVGYLRSSLDGALGRRTVLAPTRARLEDHELVVVGTPVWNASVSAPVRTWLLANRGRLRRVAFFLTHGGWKGARVLSQMEAICGRTPVATLLLRTDEVRAGTFEAKVKTFASTLAS